MRIVIDTNSLLVSIPRKSPYRPIFDALINGEVRVLISNEILNEYVEILERKTNHEVAVNISEFLIQSINVEKVEIYFRWHLIEQDVDDNKFVDCALNGSADFIVTDDKHFRVLNKIDFPSVKIIRTAEFVELLKNR